MASRVSSLVVVGIVAVAGAFVAPKLLDGLGSFIADVTGANDAVVVGEGNNALMVAADTTPKVAACPTEQILAEHRCGPLPVLVVDAARIPFIARNTRLAWESGRPAILTMNRPKQPENRKIACSKFVRTHADQCDEYPMASTEEGGSGARTEEVPPRENGCQGGMYRDQYPRDGDRFLVVIRRPDLIATQAYAGVDIAKDKGLC